MCTPPLSFISSHLFFFNDTAASDIFILSLHDALPISDVSTDRFSPVAALSTVTMALGIPASDGSETRPMLEFPKPWLRWKARLREKNDPWKRLRSEERRVGKE